MSDKEPMDVRDELPDWVAGRLGADAASRVEARVSEDEDLALESDVVRHLLDSRVDPPAGLEDRVRSAVLADAARRPRNGGAASPPRSRRPLRWGVAAAATVVLALALGDLLRRQEANAVVPVEVSLERSPSPWVTDDGMVAGEPTLAGLSDEALMSLLEELGG